MTDRAARGRHVDEAILWGHWIHGSPECTKCSSGVDRRLFIAHGPGYHGVTAPLVPGR